MTLNDYYSILGLPANSSIEDIKKAYRKLARHYHPDLNHESDAKDLFIIITQAYEFLLANHDKVNNDEQAYRQAMEEWRKYRQDRSHRRANAYARTSYSAFKNTKFYKSTRILDGASIIIGIFISFAVIIFTIIGYTYRLHHPLPGLEPPSVFSLIMLLILGVVFLIVSYAFLKVFLSASKKQKS
jgi:hypothetical protein